MLSTPLTLPPRGPAFLHCTANCRLLPAECTQNAHSGIAAPSLHSPARPPHLCKGDAVRLEVLPPAHLRLAPPLCEVRSHLSLYLGLGKVRVRACGQRQAGSTRWALA